MTNCKNCGAPLSNYICEYCGTNYSFEIKENEIDLEIKGGIGNKLLCKLNYGVIKLQ